MAIFTGAGTAIVTPFKANKEVDYETFAKNIEFQIENKIDAIIVCGTTGEASTLTHEEHLDVIRYCVKCVNGRVPVVAGTGSNCTETAIYLSQEAEKAGVDGILVVTPYYNKATQKGLYEHFKMVADSVKVPVILYNIPGRTGGVNILPETVVRLCTEVENIVGVKDATGNISQVAKLMSIAGDKVDLYSGNDDQIVPVLSLPEYKSTCPSANSISFATCEMLPLASFTPTIFSTFFTSFTMVSGKMLHPVLLGTLYNKIGRVTLFATAVKCFTRPSWVALL